MLLLPLAEELSMQARATETAGAVVVRASEQRGEADHGWLKSRHTFSFADYYDPAHMGFRTLRVINQDRVAGGGGFPTHPHRDMEIFSYVLEGELEHRDSMGNVRRLKPGEIQLMSAGRGVTHSEYNPNPDHELHFLQIWIEPRERGLDPGYTEWRPRPEHAAAAKVLLISADGREGSAQIRQDAEVYRVHLAAGGQVTHDLRPGRGMWLQVVRGTLTLNGTLLQPGDGGRIERSGTHLLRAESEAEALLFDLR